MKINKKNIDGNKEEKICCHHKLNWKIVSVTSIERELFTGPNKALVNTLIIY